MVLLQREQYNTASPERQGRSPVRVSRAVLVVLGLCASGLLGFRFDASATEIDAGQSLFVRLLAEPGEGRPKLTENGTNLEIYEIHRDAPAAKSGGAWFFLRAWDIQDRGGEMRYEATAGAAKASLRVLVRPHIPPPRPNGQVNLSAATRSKVLGDLSAVYRENAFFADFFKRPASPSVLWRGGFQLPAPGTNLSSPYGRMRIYDNGVVSFHRGTDFAYDEGTPVTAVARGKVIFAGPTVVRGNIVILDHGGGLMTSYWHLSKIDALEEDTVLPGDKVGEVGTTGLSTGPHLHFEARLGETVFDAMSLYRWPESLQKPPFVGPAPPPQVP